MDYIKLRCTHRAQGQIQGGLSLLEPTKVTLFTMILYNSENSIRDMRHLAVRCFITAVL